MDIYMDFYLATWFIIGVTFVRKYKHKWIFNLVEIPIIPIKAAEQMEENSNYRYFSFILNLAEAKSDAVIVMIDILVKSR